MRFALSFVLAALCLAPMTVAQDSVTSSAPLLSIEKVQELPWNTPVYGFSTLDPSGPKKFVGRYRGVLHGNVGAAHDWIAVELLGVPFSGGGVIAGQSGSPVFVDVAGTTYKIGTVSYGYPLARNPIALLTPINEVLASEHVHPGLPPDVSAAQARDLLAGFAPPSDMVASISSGVSASGSLSAITAGTVLGVQLAWGDFDITSFGTVSHLDGNKIFMFGHPFLQIGSAEYRLVPARVLGVQHGYDQSSIMAAPIANAAPVGVILQDRTTGISGVLGREPVLATPVSVTTTTEMGTRTFDFSTITHPALTPLIIAEGIKSIVTPELLQRGDVTIFLKESIQLDDGEISLEGTFDSPLEVAAAIGQKVSEVIQGPLGATHIKRVSVDLRMYEENRTLSVRQMSFQNGSTVRPGGYLTVRCILSRLDGRFFSGTIRIPIPADAPRGKGKIILSGQKDPERARQEAVTPPDLQAIAKLAKSRTPDALYLYTVLSSGQIRVDDFHFGDFVIVGKQELEFTITK